MEDKIIIPLEGTGSVDEIYPRDTSVTPRGDSGVNLLPVLPVGKG